MNLTDATNDVYCSRDPEVRERVHRLREQAREVTWDAKHDRLADLNRRAAALQRILKKVELEREVYLEAIALERSARVRERAQQRRRQNEFHYGVGEEFL